MFSLANADAPSSKSSHGIQKNKNSSVGTTHGATAISSIPQGKNVTLITNMGNIEVELYWNHAPATCKNFYDLCMAGYYDNSTFHRVVRDFVIQGGDPSGTGRGGECATGGYMRDEIHPELWHSGAGIISMANCGPNTNGSQFFITLAPAPSLDGKHSIFGRVKSGIETVQKISLVQTTATEKPIFDVKIIRTSTA